MTENNNSSQSLRNYGLLVGLLIGSALLLFGFILLSRSTWQTGLKTQVQAVLDRVYPGKYLVMKGIPLNSNIESFAAIYELYTPEDAVAELLGNEAPVKQYGIIMRVPTLFGPLPAVFRMSAADSVQFVGFAFHFSRFEERFSSSLFYPRISQVEQRVQKLLESARINGGTNDF